ncbi:hypothetical protein BsWGS_00665 [Bradybaena similaris]
MDVAVANRFISSLSKSLQALCHGCMDFDSGIEIVGYINVNIDSGSKVDYVLNEKVLKSTTNSMTFVSNSFLARKEQQKQTRDGACSPMPDANQQTPVVPQYQNRFRGSFHGTHPRNISQMSFAQRGSQKRSWTSMERDWRMSPKKQRDGRLPQMSPESATASQGAYPQVVTSASSQSPADAHFKYPQTSGHSSETNTADDQSEINIKKEILDNDTEKTSQNDHDPSQASDQETNEYSDEASKANNISIKNDPDAFTTTEDETNAPDGAGTHPSTDFKDTFLDPVVSEDNPDNTEQSKHEADENGDHLGTSRLTRKTSHDTEAENDQSAAPEDITAENIATGSEMPADYDEAGEEGAYPQSVYSDAGEGSSDTGQFEVIEIDDEDEDVQAMFGGSHREGPRTPHRQLHSYQTAFRHAGRARISESVQSVHMSRPHLVEPDYQGIYPESSVKCSFCDCTLETRSMFQKHMNECHREKNALPFTCSMCQKGFFSLTGLKHHIEAHGGRQFVCNVCDARFQHKHNLKRHVLGVHKLRECPECNITVADGTEYYLHVQQCGSGIRFPYSSKP